jgi:hypothetical protein
MHIGDSWHERTQWNVGQGGFHSGQVRTAGRGDWPFTYIYDCGSSSSSVHVDQAIDDFVEDLGSPPLVDALILSHVDKDHVNGVQTLFNRADVRTVFMPLLTPLERLSALSRPGLILSSFDAAFAADPLNGIRNLSERTRVVFVTRDEDAADDSDPQDPAYLADLGYAFPDTEVPTAPNSNSPRGRILGPSNGWKASDGASSAEMLDTAFVAVGDGGNEPVWSLRFYIEPRTVSKLDAFSKALSQLFGVLEHEILDWLTPAVIQHLLTTPDELVKLRQAYQDADVDANQGSLVLLSGPDLASVADHLRVGERMFLGAELTSRMGRAAWLLTGDSKFQAAGHVSDMKEHFGRHLRDLSVLSLPHHGAEPDFHVDLLSISEQGPIMAFAASGNSHPNLRHPSSKVIKQVTSHGIIPWVVTEDERSKISAATFAPRPGRRPGR